MMQLPLLPPDAVWRPPQVGDLPSWKGAKRIAVDTETNDKDLRKLGPGVRRGAYIAGYSFAIEDGPKHYVPLRHAGGDNVEDPAQAMAYLAHQAKNFDGEIVGANLGYDLDYMFHQNITFPNIKYFRDVQIAEPLIWEFANSYSLETISQKYLGIGKNEGMLREAAAAYGIDPKKDLHLLPARFAGSYAEDDASQPLLILRRQEKIIEEEELWKVFNLESELLPVLVRMRQRGVRIDLDHLTQVEQWSTVEEKKALVEVKRLTGITIPFNSVWQASALAPALEYIGCKIPLTPKTKKPSIDKTYLGSIKHPVADAINRARRVNKIRTTFCNSIREHMVDGKIHATFHQLRSSDDDDDVESGEGRGARFGRLSSSNPNMQQQPARDPEIGPFWRSCFIPEPGELFCSPDYSAQEPRLAVHYASSTTLGWVEVKAADGRRIRVNADESAKAMAWRYNNDPTVDSHQALADIIQGRIASEQERKDAKIIFLGLSYGMGGPKLCRSLGYPTQMAVKDVNTRKWIPVDTPEGKELVKQGQRITEIAGSEGQKLLDKFDESVPFVRALAKVFTRSANSRGYIRGVDDRKYRFLRDPEGNIIDAHKAMNKAIQGTAAGQCKSAMVELDKAGYSMILQVHDEVCLSIKDKNEGKRISEIMENVYKLAVPFRVDCAIGTSWGDAK